MTATSADHEAMREAIAIWRRVRGPVPATIRALAFDQTGSLRAVGTNAVTIFDRGSTDAYILVSPGRSSRDVRRSVLHEMCHASDAITYGPAVMAADRDTIERRAARFAEMHA